MRDLHPNLKSWLAQYNANIALLDAGGFKQTSTNAREGLAVLTKSCITNIPDISWVQDDIVYTDDFDVPVRIYHPKPSQEYPVLIYFHGGGHMGGSVTVYDPICRKLAQASGHIVVSVDYRLAPECPYPAGLNDAIGVVNNIWKTLDDRHLRYKRILSIGGDSAGGAIASSVAAITQSDPKVDIKSQILIYPSLDYTMSTFSIKENAEGYLLSKEKIAWYFDNYFQHDEDRSKASALFANFSDKLPNTLLFTAEFCPLRDEGLLYIDKLKQVGAQAEHVHFEDMIHAFLNLEDIVPQACETVYTRIGKFLNTH